MNLSKFALVGLAVPICLAVVNGPPAAASPSDPWSGLPPAPSPWPPARLLVWAKPGQSGRVDEPANWCRYDSLQHYLQGATGRPASRGPDEHTDVVLPDAPPGRPYVVGFQVLPRHRAGGFDAPQWRCRHLAIGANAGLDGGCTISRGRPAYSPAPGYDTGMGIAGNLTIGPGGWLYGQLTFFGDRPACFRLDEKAVAFGKSWTIRKDRGAGLTVLAEHYTLADGLAVLSGGLTLAEGCRLRFGAGYQRRLDEKKLGRLEQFHRECDVYVGPDGRLELSAGTLIGRARPPRDIAADLRIEGTLHIGRSDDETDRPAVIELTMAEGDGRFLGQPGGLYLLDGARVRNLGRLQVTAARPDGPAAAGKGISLFLEKEVDLGQVSLDYLRAGGIVCPDPQRQQAMLGSARFGPHCGTDGRSVFARLDRLDFQGGLGTVEFVDGLKTRCYILYPHAGRLIVRSEGYRTLQSFDLNSIHAVTIGTRRIVYHPRRPLNEQEKQLRQYNALWGDVPGPGQVGRYGRQVWPHCPVMVWRYPGRSDSRFVGANWLDEHGRPYFQVPLISQRAVRSDNPPIDMLLPAADRPYVASGWGQGGNEGAPPHRHLTIEFNACYGSTYNVQGNLWMKHGSGLSGWHRGRFGSTQPSVHRFIRFDGLRIPYRRGDINAPLIPSADAVLAQWAHFQAGSGSTIELIGRIQAAADRLYIEGPGTLIVSENSELADGARAGISVMPGATLVLLQDARVGTEIIRQHSQCYASLWVDGTLMIGLPDRPIRHDMAFPLSGVMKELINRDPGGGMRLGGCSFVLGPQGRMVVHSADPARARLVFKLHDSPRARQKGARFTKGGIPQGIVLYFGGQALLDGVVFDNVHEGGIMVSEQTRATWKNVFYGRHNLAEPQRLYWILKPSPATAQTQAGR